MWRGYPFRNLDRKNAAVSWSRNGSYSSRLTIERDGRIDNPLEKVHNRFDPYSDSARLPAIKHRVAVKFDPQWRSSTSDNKFVPPDMVPVFVENI